MIIIAKMVFVIVLIIKFYIGCHFFREMALENLTKGQNHAFSIKGLFLTPTARF